MGRIWVALLALGGAAAIVPPAAAGESPGCRVEHGAPPEVVEIDGREREAIVVPPEDYNPEVRHALVFAFHGRTNDNAKARRYFGLEEAALRPTIHIYPAGLKDETGRFTWWTPGEPDLRDYAFFDLLLERALAAYCIDPAQVYVVGHSLGASFANSLACARADRIRGLVSVAGGINPSRCEGTVAAILLHNPDDQLTPIAEGERARDVLLGRSADEIEPSAEEVGGFACQLYRDMPDPLLWCPHDQDQTEDGRVYPHQWPAATAAIVAELVRSLWQDERPSEAEG